MRKIGIFLAIMLIISGLGILALQLDASPKSEAARKADARGPAGLIVGIGFESLFDKEIDWSEIRHDLDETGAEGVTLAIGRPEWLGFPWEGREELWSTPAQRADTDRVHMIAEELVSGTERDLTLTIDILAPKLIESDSDAAGVFADGEVSDNFVSATALHEGTLADAITDLCGEAASRYSPDRIALTELMGDSFFGSADEKLYSEMTGNEGFPHTEAGDIDIADPELQEWQVGIISTVVERCADAADDLGVAVDTDVRANWDQPGADRLDSGHSYQALFDAGDYLTIWAYYGLDGRPADELEDLNLGLVERFSDDDLNRITLSIGLWGENSEEAVSPKELSAGMESAERGVGNISVTPMSLMTEEHWDVLRDRQTQLSED